MSVTLLILAARFRPFLSIRHKISLALLIAFSTSGNKRFEDSLRGHGTIVMLL